MNVPVRLPLGTSLYGIVCSSAPSRIPDAVYYYLIMCSLYNLQVTVSCYVTKRLKTFSPLRISGLELSSRGTGAWLSYVMLPVCAMYSNRSNRTCSRTSGNGVYIRRAAPARHVYPVHMVSTRRRTTIDENATSSSTDGSDRSHPFVYEYSTQLSETGLRSRSHGVSHPMCSQALLNKAPIALPQVL